MGAFGRRARGGCDGLITCLPSPKASAAVMDLALPALRAGSTWIEMSTNDFAEIEALARGQRLGINPRLPGHRRRAPCRGRRDHGTRRRRAGRLSNATGPRCKPWAERSSISAASSRRR
jgi:hypothetical protein